MQTLRPTLLAAAAALSLALTALAPHPAQANHSDTAKIITGLAALAIIGSAIHHSNRHHHGVSRHYYGYSPYNSYHRPHRSYGYHRYKRHHHHHGHHGRYRRHR